MPKIHLLYPSNPSVNVDGLVEQLAEHGLECADLASDDTDAPLVAIAEPVDPEVFFEIGRHVGANRAVIILGDHPEVLPRGMREVSFVALSGPDLGQRLVARIQETIGLQTTAPGGMTSLEEFARWLAEDARRLETLDSLSLGNLTRLLFEGAGFETRTESALGKFDFVVHNPALKTQWLVECKASFRSQPLGLGALRRVRDYCGVRNLHFACLISNSRFTPAATDWAARSMPAVHLFDIEWLRSALSGVIERKVAHHYLSSRLLLPGFTEDKMTPEYTPRVREYRMTTLPVWAVSSRQLAARKGKRLHAWQDLDLCLILVGDMDQKLRESIRRLDSWCEEGGMRSIHLALPAPTSVTEWREILRRSRTVVMVLSSDISADRQDERLAFQTVTDSIDDLTAFGNLFVVAPDSPFRRLSLPTCISREQVFNVESDDWLSSLRGELRFSADSGQDSDSDVAGMGEDTGVE